MCLRASKIQRLSCSCCLQTFFFRDKGEVAQKSSSAPEGWHGSHGVLRREYQVIQYVMHRKWLKAINWNVCLDSRENTCNAYQHIHLIQIYTLKS